MFAVQGGGSQSTLVTVLSHPAPDVAVATVLITEATVQCLDTSMLSKHKELVRVKYEFIVPTQSTGFSFTNNQTALAAVVPCNTNHKSTLINITEAGVSTYLA